MRFCCRHNFVLLIGGLLCATSAASRAETGVLVVHVKDVQRRPISGVQIGVEGDGGSAITGDDGKARIQLAKQTKEKSWVSLQIVKSPPNKDFVVVSPWDYRTLVPSFENESENFVEVVVVQRRDRAALESNRVLLAVTEQINKANTPGNADKQALQENSKANLVAVAKQYGIAPDDLDQAIRAWGARTTDPYEAGLAALYERKYAKASAQLADSLQKREETLAADQKAVADAACFLGQSRMAEGRYRDSVTAYQRCLQLQPDNSATMNNLAVSQADAGDYAAAEPLYQHALAIDREAQGPDGPDVAADLNNLAALLYFKGDYDGAEPLYRQALAINEKALGPDNPLVAADLNNLGLLLKIEGDYAEAAPLYQRALAIRKKVLGAENPLVGESLNNIAELLHAEGDNKGAERLNRQALAIREKALRPDHPDIAISLNNIAELLRAKGDYAGEEPLYRRALAIDERAFPPDHPTIAVDLNNLGLLFQSEGHYSAAEPLFQRAVAIDEKGLGPDHPTTKRFRYNLESLRLKMAAQKTGK
jgi:tetratricopeptide (TPR) repeat protein